MITLYYYNKTSIDLSLKCGPYKVLLKSCNLNFDVKGKTNIYLMYWYQMPSNKFLNPFLNLTNICSIS